MKASQGESRLDTTIFMLSVIAGTLIALCISVGVRQEAGYLSGLRPKPLVPLAHLLDKPAPEFELKGLDGTTVSLAKIGNTTEKIVLFTDAGCRACDAAYPSLEAAAAQLPVLVVGIGGRQILADKLARYTRLVLVGYDSLQIVKKQYGVNSFPSTLLLDREDVVRHTAVGSKSITQVVDAWKVEREGAYNGF